MRHYNLHGLLDLFSFDVASLHQKLFNLTTCRLWMKMFMKMSLQSIRKSSMRPFMVIMETQVSVETLDLPDIDLNQRSKIY